MAFNFKPLLVEGLVALNIEATDKQLRQLMGYLELLEKSRKKINLVSVDGPARLVSHHVLDSLSVLPYLQGDRVLDFGTGAGFPGLPLACLNPQQIFCLLDSRSRRIEFLNYVCQLQKINNVQLVAQRVQGIQLRDAANDYSAPQHSKKFDTLVCRAVASMQDLLDMTKHLHEPGVRFIAMKGQPPEKEMQSLTVAKPYSVRIEPVVIPNLDAQRHLVIIDFLQ